MSRPISASAYLPPPTKPAALAPPPPPAAPSALANESWTSTNHSVTSKGGTVNWQASSQPAFRRNGSSWSAIDTSVTPSTGTFAAAAEDAIRPIHFGSQAAQLLQIDFDKGPVTVSAATLAISAPGITSNQVTYASVAAGADLRYRVLPGGVKEEIVLHSSVAPTTYVFHVADPNSQLGTIKQQPDGSWQFDLTVDGLNVQLAPAFAYEQPVGGLPQIDPGSGHLTVVPSVGGFDVTESIDAGWLVGKSYPIVLDPTINFSAATGTGVDNYTPKGCGGCNTVTTTGELYAVTYTGGSYDLEPGRSYFKFDLSQIPAGSLINSAQLVLEVGGCITTASVCNSRSYVIELHAMTGSWTASNTWTQLTGLTSSTALVSLTQNAFNTTYFNETFSSTAFANQVQTWVNTPSSNYGFEVQLQNDTQSSSYNIGGPFYCFHGTWWCLQSGWNPPSLQITYSTPPAAPPAVTATAGDQNASVNWTPANNGGSSITSYTVLTQDANGNPFGSPVTACGTCTTATASGLSYGLNYRFGVYATNAVGSGPTTWSAYSTVPLPATVSVTAPQSLYARGQLVSYSLSLNNPAATAVTVNGITDAMAPVLSPGVT